MKNKNINPKMTITTSTPRIMSCCPISSSIIPSSFKIIITTHLKTLRHSHRDYPVLTKEKNIGGIKKWK